MEDIKKEECTIDIAGLNLYKKIQLVKEELAFNVFI